MKQWKTLLSLVMALLLCFCLAACGSGTDELYEEDPNDIVGDDWRTTGIIQEYGTITRNGEDTPVAVCVHAEDAAFYYDSEEQTLFDSVDYPIALTGDPWEAFQSIDFADRNGDGNSDVAMTFVEDGDTMLMVWFWNGENDMFEFQPEESQLTEETAS